MGRRVVFLGLMMAAVTGCPDLTKSERRPRHRSGFDNAEPTAPPSPAGDDGTDPAADDGVDRPAPAAPVRPQVLPGGRPGGGVRPGQPPIRRVPPDGRNPGALRRPLQARPVPAPPPSDMPPEGRP